jgi:hypothetical protein
MRAITAASRSTSPERFSTNTAIGTPQARCRLMHQSGRPATIAPRRLRPASGMKRVSPIAPSARARIALPSSIAMNHCGVARKITGFLERHECG